MKAITEYECEICGRRHHTENSALECESKGYFNSDALPIGTMYEHHHNGYVGIFAVSKFEKCGTSKHLGTITAWAFRVPPYPLGGMGSVCGNGSLMSSDNHSIGNWKKHHYITPEKVGSKEFNMMADGLKSIGITPTYYTPDGKLITIT